jgi:hypothetical protein
MAKQFCQGFLFVVFLFSGAVFIAAIGGIFRVAYIAVFDPPSFAPMGQIQPPEIIHRHHSPHACAHPTSSPPMVFQCIGGVDLDD